MKKPLLAGAGVVLFVGVLLGSAPASAETVFVDSVWNADSRQFEFYDSSLNDSSYFASLRREFGGQIFEMKTPFVFNPDSGKEGIQYSFYAFPDGYYGNSSAYYRKDYYKASYSGGVYRVIESAAESHYIDSEPNEFGGLDARSDYYYNIEGYSSDDPAVVRSALSTAFSAIPFDGVGIFDFEQSFIHYGDFGREGYSISLADSLRGGLLGLNCDTCSQVCYYDRCYSENFPVGLGDFYLDNINSDGSLFARWDNSYIYYNSADIIGITLAYNLPAVPEPETWAMLLAGLGIVGAVAHRRRIKAAI
jgi:hypothetical protein